MSTRASQIDGIAAQRAGTLREMIRDDLELELEGVVAAPVRLIELAAENTPELVTAINVYASRLPGYVSALREAAAHPALLVVGIVAINDFNDLLFDCVAGRGRSALRTARTLFEHHLNLLALDDDETRDRFMCHHLVGTVMAASWNPVEAFLTGNDRKAVRHRQHKLRRDVRAELDEAIATYGNGFLRQWHPVSVRDRAIDAGLTAEYEFFRASSAAVHGSASSLEGSFWIVEGEPVVRVGPAVIACPASLAAGLRFFRLLIERLETDTKLVEPSLRDTLSGIGRQVEEFCRYTNGLEAFLFQQDDMARPTTAPQQLVLGPSAAPRPST